MSVAISISRWSGNKKYVLQTDTPREDVPLEYIDQDVWHVLSTFVAMPRADLEDNLPG